ncbi:MAG: hypothetical protein HPY44_12815 [Armatimonadetes bacterium]|nr:hypothetical protein [Armatimonadota bacterium]
MLFSRLLPIAAIAATLGGGEAQYVTPGVSPGSSVVFDARQLDWDERCTAEALQGLVNRSGPRLFLHGGAAYEQRWLDIYAERAGLKYERLSGLRNLLARFGGETGGLVVYDPTQDASRYVAITLAGVEGLIPVSTTVLEGRSPGMRPTGEWGGADFVLQSPAELQSWRRAANPVLSVESGKGLWVQEGNPTAASPWSFISIGPVLVDLDRYPFLEADVAELQGEGAGWQIKLTWDRDGSGHVSGGEDDLCLPLRREPGLVRWNINELTGLRGKHAFALVQLHVLGEGAKVLWRRVRFVSQNGQSADELPAQPLDTAKLPVKHDLRGQFTDTISAYEWALRELMPKCSRRLAHTVNGGQVDGINVGVCGPMSGFDWQTQNRGFVFNLGCTAEKRVSYGTVCGGSPEQAAMYERILDALETPAQINGYGDPEGEWCQLLSRHGHYSFHAFTNWSFHNKVPCARSRFEQRANFVPETTEPETERFYVCFMTSEGDTMKGPIPFFYDSWFDQARGKVPVNWGINPLMAELFPAMLDYYYDTATPEDYFFVGCSGAGYCYPDDMKDLDRFARHTAEACANAGTPVIDLWGASRPDVQEKYATITRPLGMTVNCAPARLKLLSDGTPVAYHELAYWQTDGLDGAPWSRVFATEDGRRKGVERIVTRIEDIAARHQPPFVILVYGDLHSYPQHATLYKDIADALDPRRFKPARLDEAMAGIRKWAYGRVVMGSEGINERLSWAALEGVPTRIPLTLSSGCQEPTVAMIQVRAGATKCSARVPLEARQTRQVEDLVLAVARGEKADTARVTLRAAGRTQRSRAALCVVPCVADIDRATFAACWSATALNRSMGGAVSDPAALWGRAWGSPELPAKPGCMIYGPYAPMPAGRYLVAFRVMLSKSATTDPDVHLATLDVHAGGYGGIAKVCGQADLRRRDFAEAGAWQWFTVQTDWPGLPSLMETRVTWHARAPIVVDRVAVFRLD